MDWAPCEPNVELPGAECAVVNTLLELSNPYAGTTAIAIARIPAPTQPARGQLWFVTGGPGDSGIEDLASAAGLQALVPDLDLLTLDHRGVGGSGRLSCPVQEDPASEQGFEIAPGEWAACLDHVVATYGDNLGTLTVTNAATDLVLATDAVHEDGDQVYWWGVSYGTYLLERALHLGVPDGVILDGLVPVDWTFTEFDGGLDTVARQFLEECGRDPSCAGHFDGEPVAVAERVVANLAPKCTKLGLDPEITRLLTGVILMPGEPYATLGPAIWSRLDRCSGADRRALIHLFDALFPEDGTGIAEKPGHSPVLQRHLAYAELWAEDAPSADDLYAALDGVISTTEVSASFAELAGDWPVIPPRDALHGQWPNTRVPILAMHGGFDPTMPLDRVAGFEGWLAEEDQHLVRVPYAEHVTVNRGDCPASIYAAFLTDPTADLDTSCVDDMPSYDWDGDPGFNEEIFGTEDRWGSEGCGCGGGNAGGFAVAAALVLVRRRSSPHRPCRGT